MEMKKGSRECGCLFFMPDSSLAIGWGITGTFVWGLGGYGEVLLWAG
jgi:hypothetical protein